MTAVVVALVAVSASSCPFVFGGVVGVVGVVGVTGATTMGPGAQVKVRVPPLATLADRVRVNVKVPAEGIVADPIVSAKDALTIDNGPGVRKACVPVGVPVVVAVITSPAAKV